MSRRERGRLEGGASSAATLRRLAGMSRQVRASTVAALALAVVGVLLNLAGPRIWGSAIDAVLAGTAGSGHRAGAAKRAAGIDFGRVGLLLLLAAGVYSAGTLAGFLQQHLQNGAGARIVHNLRHEVEQKLNRLPVSYFHGSSRGELLSRMTNDIDNISTTLSRILTQLLFGLLTVAGVLAMMLSISPVLTLLALISIPLSFAVANMVAMPSQRLFDDQWRLTGELNAHIEEAYSGHELVTVFDHTGAFRETFAEKSAELKKASYRAQLVSGLIGPLVLFIGNLGYVLLCVVGAFQVMSGRLPWATSSRSSNTPDSPRSHWEWSPRCRTSSSRVSRQPPGCSPFSTSRRSSPAVKRGYRPSDRGGSPLNTCRSATGASRPSRTST